MDPCTLYMACALMAPAEIIEPSQPESEARESLEINAVSRRDTRGPLRLDVPGHEAERGPLDLEEIPPAPFSGPD
jgi:hypothetical protein